MSATQTMNDRQDELRAALQEIGVPNSSLRRVYRRYPTQGAGFGLFAIEDICRGTAIIIEEALFSVTRNAQISRKAQGHPKFNELHCPPGPNGQIDDQRRFAANSFEMGPIKKGIFLEASRLNHSCIPNAYFNWRGAANGLGRLIVYAITDIQRGMQILVNYGAVHDSCKDVTTRQQEFNAVYDFSCDCAACVPSAFRTASELRRQEMITLKTSILGDRDFIPTDTAAAERQIARIQTVHSHLVSNGTVYPQQADNWREFAWYYKQRYGQRQGRTEKWSQEIRSEALNAARQSLYLDIVCTGSDSSRVKEALSLIERLKREMPL